MEDCYDHHCFFSYLFSKEKVFLVEKSSLEYSQNERRTEKKKTKR